MAACLAMMLLLCGDAMGAKTPRAVMVSFRYIIGVYSGVWALILVNRHQTIIGCIRDVAELAARIENVVDLRGQVTKAQFLVDKAPKKTIISVHLFVETNCY